MEFLEIPLFDDDVYKLGVRFLFNILFLVLLLRFAIRPTTKEREFAFSVVMMNVTVFFICFTLKKLDLGLGMALGLFAIFGILRYRADAIRTKEMTYLFIVIAMAVINALSNRKTSYTELLLVNMVILGAALLKESNLFNLAGIRDTDPFVESKAKARNKNRTAENLPQVSDTADPMSLETKSKQNKASKNNRVNRQDAKGEKYNVQYDQLQLLGSLHRDELLADLRRKTGINIQRVRIQNIDLPNQTATLTVWAEPTVAPTVEPTVVNPDDSTSENPPA